MAKGVSRILEWLRAGYPDGIPPHDYPPVLGVLRRSLTETDIEEIADELALQSISNGAEPVTADQVRAMVREHAFQSCTADDMARVSAQLARGGWPLSADLQD
ncbi:DUF3349 domain-containing protein [Nocardioides sp.]|jgi:hypothetical protein|uniref:DUF3349 domain-containing protein n=1 Tax=Nocardioides sp. TaxID=35761 RepID=UPI002BD35D5D|nr:DUF3349 domain-containing protein [Nocardioides sp.]HVX54875.1 DUF3349 domain-containing protein [Nocardioides sp.]